MPKEANLQLQDKDGQPLAAPVHVTFDDDEWTLLTRFAEYARDVAETPIVNILKRRIPDKRVSLVPSWPKRP